MEDLDLKELWQSYHKKVEANLVLNRKNAEDISKLKAKSYLLSMRPLKIFTIVIGLLWVIGVYLLLLHAFQIGNYFFLVSAAVQVVLTQLAIGVYIYQLVLINQVDVSDPIVKVQERLAQLKTSTLWIARFLFLQLPVWSTFYLHRDMLHNGAYGIWALQIAITVSLTWLALWLFFNIRNENRHKRWFRWIFQGGEWEPVIKAMEMLEEIEEYRDRAA
jgi:hypothetical protein